MASSRARVFCAAALVLGCCAAAWSQKAPRKPFDVEVLETHAHRGETRINFDVRVKFYGEKPLRGLIVYFDLMSPENGVVTSQKVILDQGPVDPDDERYEESVTPDVARAVKFKIRAFDTQERDLRVGNAGPFPIE